MTRLEFESYLRMVKALIKTNNIKELENVIDETLETYSKDRESKIKKEK